ncbi:hypothetical protein AJ79_02368 [Helicocarpus griseus UAMH5409]|uniref:Kynurenine formamidase n=1 Tax=Helicocarpus griseus UAMH5409 TaxID=1447875 RepID=A0A2B7Y281_9EURO|nr:hypothetical protein AJ79_02368 [Helicocarpus griseus UAMH5409]
MASRISSHFHQENHRYGQENILQNVSVYLPRSVLQKNLSTDVWILYIHGGAWRDPEITSTSFEPALEAIVSNYGSGLTLGIAGLASIDYRLTAHPDFPQDPLKTKPAHLRKALHPDHLNDVHRAIAFLQNKYGFAERYILVGHSCGATLAFQTVMKPISNDRAESDDGPGAKAQQPMAIVGVDGIYDLRLLRDHFNQYPIYQTFIEAAFGSEDVWDVVSPATVKGQSGIEGGWSNGRLAVLAHSEGDELVDMGQLRVMSITTERWRAADTQEQLRSVLLLDDLKGGHDDVWSKGEELAQVITRTVNELGRLDRA